MISIIPVHFDITYNGGNKKATAEGMIASSFFLPEYAVSFVFFGKKKERADKLFAKKIVSIVCYPFDDYNIRQFQRRTGKPVMSGCKFNFAG